MVEVIGTEEFEAWYQDLDEKDTEAVTRVVGLLEARGVALPSSYSSGIEDTRFPLRELRIQSGGHPLRVFSVPSALSMAAC